MRVCAFCGVGFEIPLGMGRPRVWCSDGCALKGREKRREGNVKVTLNSEGLPVEGGIENCLKCGTDHRLASGILGCIAHSTREPHGPCQSPPINGGTVCAKHGGSLPAVRKAAAARLTLAVVKAEMDSLGGSLDCDPAQAMLAMVREAAWNVAFLRSQISVLRVHSDSEMSGVDSLVGRTSPADWKMDVNVLVKMYDSERDRLVRYAKLCRDAGVQERVVQIAEETGAAMVRMLDQVFEMLELSTEQQMRLPAVMGQVLGGI